MKTGLCLPHLETLDGIIGPGLDRSYNQVQGVVDINENFNVEIGGMSFAVSSSLRQYIRQQYHSH
jgi:hypothetical protein